MKLTDDLLLNFTSDIYYGDMGLSGYKTLIETVKKLKLDKYDIEKLTDILEDKIKNSIEYDTSKWGSYVVRPSKFINSPNSILYKDNSEIINKEIEYLFNTKPKNDVWGITWTWFDNMNKYEREFYISENWWKGFIVIENMILFKNFNFL